LQRAWSSDRRGPKSVWPCPRGSPKAYRPMRSRDCHRVSRRAPWPSRGFRTSRWSGYASTLRTRQAWLPKRTAVRCPSRASPAQVPSRPCGRPPGASALQDGRPLVCGAARSTRLARAAGGGRGDDGHPRQEAGCGALAGYGGIALPRHAKPLETGPSHHLGPKRPRRHRGGMSRRPLGCRRPWQGSRHEPHRPAEPSDAHLERSAQPHSRSLGRDDAAGRQHLALAMPRQARHVATRGPASADWPAYERPIDPRAAVPLPGAMGALTRRETTSGTTRADRGACRGDRPQLPTSYVANKPAG